MTPPIRNLCRSPVVRLRRSGPPAPTARRCPRRSLAPPAPARRGYGYRTSMPVVDGTGVDPARPGQGSYAPLPRRAGTANWASVRTASLPRRVGGTAMARVAPWWTVCPSCRYRRVRVPTRRCRQSAWHGMPGDGTALRRRPARRGYGYGSGSAVVDGMPNVPVQACQGSYAPSPPPWSPARQTG